MDLEWFLRVPCVLIRQYILMLEADHVLLSPNDESSLLYQIPEHRSFVVVVHCFIEFMRFFGAFVRSVFVWFSHGFICLIV